MSDSLLPPSASDFLKYTGYATDRITRIPVDLRTLWDPEACPVELLPYLAWALSVERWDKNWPEETKRKVIRESWLIHRHKGTFSSLRRIVEPLGYIISMSEWWETGDPPGTFRLNVGVFEGGLTEEMYFEIERLIADARPVSRHLVGLNIVQDISGKVYTGGMVYDGDIITVYPIQESDA
ncbi:TPA: phage tail protein I [Escherichia coli]|jgi:phage tail P2-like protein|uniref:phage tail protein I n=3 Tax=Escherichia coli TaxID=562 RepID=UPI00053A4A91|nr:phage tail protein I [Escherichia coli]HBC2946757.1 phage tail protein I [Escherichia coli O146]HDQ6573423.1 phage tail protein I [Escherichia coli O128:H2]HDQ6609967.1 phage tail protein I [Escherichia coli Ou:H21]HDQ6879488.1 phage tail protein I [Escherichia coli O174:H8]HDQ6951088.1 phage tail protein I [Escherichia coli Ou:H8]